MATILPKPRQKIDPMSLNPSHADPLDNVILMEP
jgi:hypothetical protein